MKAIAVLIVLGALSMFGCAFLGIWTAPGLEGLPTVDVLGKDRAKDLEESEKPESGIFPMGNTQMLPEGVSFAGEANTGIEKAGGEDAPSS